MEGANEIYPEKISQLPTNPKKQIDGVNSKNPTDVIDPRVYINLEQRKKYIE